MQSRTSICRTPRRQYNFSWHDGYTDDQVLLNLVFGRAGR
jgi:hypothetical protein